MMRTTKPTPMLTLPLLLASVTGCTAPAPDPALDAVRQIGGMRDVMRDGRTEPRVELARMVNRPHAHAVGALAGLAGEITIHDGSVWVARVNDRAPLVTGPEVVAGDAATLLTLAYVRDWHPVPITVAAEGAALESLIADAIAASGLDPAAPCPFIIEGVAGPLEIHVINGSCPVASDPATLPAGANAEPWRWTGRPDAPVTIVGFFAPDTAGVMTHHGSAIHAHAIITRAGRTVTGHLDHFQVVPGMTLRVPGPSWLHHMSHQGDRP